MTNHLTSATGLRPWLLLVVISAVTVLAGACGSDEPGSGPLRLAVDGRAVVEHADGEAIVVEGVRRLELGTRVEMVSGTASLEYPDGTTYELREGLDAADHTSLVARDHPLLETGDLLVVGADGAEVAVQGVTIRVHGDGKVGRHLSLLAQVYEGRAQVRSAGRSVEVPALRQVSVPAARLVPAAPSPLAYDDTDPWDRRYLAEAIGLGESLVARARGFTAQLQPGEGRSPGFYRLLLPELEDQPGFGGDLISAERLPGETLVGAAIAVAADDSMTAAEFRDRWNEVFDFRDDGAQWGLVALDQHVADVGLIDRVDAAIARAPLAQVAVGPSGGGSPGPSGPSEPSGPSNGDNGSEPPPTTTEPPPTTTTTQPPDDITDIIDDLIEPDPGDSGDGDDDGVLDPLVDESGDPDDDGLLGGLLEAAAGATGSLVEGVGDVLLG